MVQIAMAALPLAALLTAPGAWREPLPTQFRWSVSEPLLAPLARPGEEAVSVKDPSVVFDGERWHVFCTVRGRPRTHRIEHFSFADWDRTEEAERTMLTMHAGYLCAPQVFYFEPEGRWYLICQASDEAWNPAYQAAFSTTETIDDPDSWSPLQPLGQRPAGDKYGLDFWVICDEAKAHLFFTTLDGRMWREETSLAEFPHGWSDPVIALEGDVFEASHTYRLSDGSGYLTLIEAQGEGGRRYYKAYAAEVLEGPWSPVADTRERPFAGLANLLPNTGWTDSVSHGELIRSGRDQRLEVDPADLRFVFQGVRDADREGRAYGDIPWRIGLLTREGAAQEASVAPPEPDSPWPLAPRLTPPWRSSGSILLRFPETLHTSHGLLYIDHARADMPPLYAGTPEARWTRDTDGSLGYNVGLPNGVVYGGRLTPRGDRVELQFRLRNGSDEDSFAATQFCLVLSDSPEFRDRDYTRTFVHTAEGWVRASEADRGPMNPRWCLYGLEAGATPPPQPDPALWGISTVVPDVGLIAVMSPEGDRVLGYAWERPGFLMNNAMIPCLHADPVWGPLPRGAETTARGMVYFLEGGLDDLLERYGADFP